jgi:hypothetical protein
MEKVRKTEGLFVKRSDGTLIAGFYRGGDPNYGDNEEVWCVKCQDSIPNSTVEKQVNPIIYQYFDQYSDEVVENNLDNVDKCKNCGGRIPARVE